MLLGIHSPSALLSVNLGLPLRNPAALDDFIARFARRGIYMTRAQFNARFAPTGAQVDAVRRWAMSGGLRVSYVSGNRALITLRGSSAAFSSALHVTINDYRGPTGLHFFSNDRDPSLPASLGVSALSGLNDIPHLRTAIRPGAPARASADGYTPSDFRTAYNVTTDGTGQTIGFTLWGAPLPDSDLAGFAAATGDVPMSAGLGPDQIEWLSVDGGSSCTDSLDETALDVESAHGIATHAHLKYWLAPEVGCGLGGSDVGMEDAVAAAADDPAVHVVSNSWLDGDDPQLSDPFVQITTTAFKMAVAVGTTFYFATGDCGAQSGDPDCVGSPRPSYPADSPYVVAVGGTSLALDSTSHYVSETAWNGSGGGCSRFELRPSWQTGVAAASCANRAIPDIAADADPATGALVFFNGAATEYGGTSLSTPLIAGLAVAADHYAVAHGLARLGWAAPLIYTMANNSATYAVAFHDVTRGNNGGYAAGPGWDQVTGWGSLNWFPWMQAAAQLLGTAPSATTTPTLTPSPSATSTSSPSATPTASPTVTVTATDTTGDVAVTSAVAAGWNLFGLAVTPADPLRASAVLQTLLNATGGHLAALYQLTGNRWSPALVDRRTTADLLSGEDFTLASGQGYLLYSDVAGSFSLRGAAPGGAVAWNLAPGWNLVAPIYATQLRASDVLHSLLSTGAGLAAMYMLQNTQWNPYLIGRRGAATTGQDFQLQAGQGYLLYTDTAAAIAPGAPGIRSGVALPRNPAGESSPVALPAFPAP